MSETQVDTIKVIFSHFIETNGIDQSEKFTPKFILSHELWKWNKKINLKNKLIEAGINPDCVLVTKKGLYKKNDQFLFDIMNQLEDLLGSENLNVNYLENYGLISPPKTLRTGGNFPLTDSINFPIKEVSTNSILISLQRTFETSWDDILKRTGRESVVRKKAKYSIDEILSIYLEKVTAYYDCSEKELTENVYSIINQNDLKQDLPKVYKLLWRLPATTNINYDTGNQLLLGIEIITFYSKNLTLSGIEDHLLKFDAKEKLAQISKIKKRKNNDLQNQIDILQGYANGFFGHGDYFGDETLYRYINHMKSGTDSYFRKIGIELSSLKKLKVKLNRKYNSREKIWERLRELVSKSMTDNFNYLTREWLEKNDPALINDSFIIENIKTNSWEKVLKLYGLNPIVWNNSYPIRSYRGFVFEKSIKNILADKMTLVSSLNHLDAKSFLYNKLVSKGIKPDFIFTKFILDTKFSVSVNAENIINERTSNQLEKYSDFFDKEIILLTFNQREKTTYTKTKRIPIKIINIKSMVDFFFHHYQLRINEKEITEVYENINSIPFWKIK